MINPFNIKKSKTQDLLTVSILLLLMVTFNTYSQDLVIKNGANMMLADNSILTAKANLILDGTLTSASSNINLEGDFSGSGNYNFTNTTLVLSGTNAQNISYNLNTGIDNLEVNGGSEKTFSTNLSVSKKLLLKSGILNINDNTLNLNGVLEGGNSQSYVKGKFQKKLTADDNQAIFPIGNQNYAPILIKNLTVTQDTQLAMKVFDENPNATFDSSTIIDFVSTSRYWKKEQVSPNIPIIIGKIALWLGENDTQGITKENAVVMAGEDTNQSFVSLNNNRIDDQDYITANELFLDNHQIFTLAKEKNFDDLDCIPNVFEENNTNENDKVFKIFCPNLSKENFSLYIYNKWGALVWNTNDLEDIKTKGWNGFSNNGVKLPPGAYDYIAKGKYSTGKTFLKHGILFKLD